MKLPKCCTDHIAGYIGINPDEYPKERAALCCSGCLSRLTYNGGKWNREQGRTEAVLGRATLKPQKVVPDKPAIVAGGLLDLFAKGD